jgi:hypothetical protein
MSIAKNGAVWPNQVKKAGFNWLALKGIRWGPTRADFKTFLEVEQVGICLGRLYCFIQT